MYILYLILGLILLYYGAEFLVRGSSSIAVSFGVNKMVIGLTVVALGTSMPEFVVSLTGAITGSDGVSVGNIVGSNMANILLVLGITGFIGPIKAEKRTIKLDMPVLLLITLLFIFFCYDGLLTGYESIMLLFVFMIYMLYIIKNSREISGEKKEASDPKSNKLTKNIMLSLVGIIGLVLGGKYTVQGGVEMGQLLGISDYVIGLTVIALGTSLPELFTSVVAALKHEHEISIGNIIGSNMFNTAFVLGIVPIISPLKISEKIIGFDNWLMLGVTILLGICTYSGKRLSRGESALFLLIYALFILNIIFNS